MSVDFVRILPENVLTKSTGGVDLNIQLSIKIGLARCDMKQKDVAAKLGKSKQIVSFWVTGDRMPKLEDVSSLASCFGVPVSEFIKWGE